jgi:hypothetical protein
MEDENVTTVHAYLDEATGSPAVAIIVRERADPANGVTITLNPAGARKVAQWLLEAAVIAQCERFLSDFVVSRLDFDPVQQRLLRVAFRTSLEQSGVIDHSFASGDLEADTP